MSVREPQTLTYGPCFCPWHEPGPHNWPCPGLAQYLSGRDIDRYHQAYSFLCHLDRIHYDATGEWTPNVGIARKEWAAVTKEFLRRPNTISQVTTRRTISDRQCADKRIIRNLWHKNTHLAGVNSTEGAMVIALNNSQEIINNFVENTNDTSTNATDVVTDAYAVTLDHLQKVVDHFQRKATTIENLGNDALTNDVMDLSLYAFKTALEDVNKITRDFNAMHVTLNDLKAFVANVKETISDLEWLVMELDEKIDEAKETYESTKNK